MADGARSEGRGVAFRVRLLGPVADADLPALYAAATVFVLPSQYEGFGLPVLEAMASGTPVILTSASAMPEVAADAGNYIQPDDPDSLRDAMTRLIEDPTHWQACRAAGLHRAKLFSWERCAKVTARAYRQAMGD